MSAEGRGHVPDREDVHQHAAGGAVGIVDPELTGNLARVADAEHGVHGGEVRRREAGRFDHDDPPEAAAVGEEASAVRRWAHASGMLKGTAGSGSGLWYGAVTADQI